jgi:hypothetical protein
MASDLANEVKNVTTLAWTTIREENSKETNGDFRTEVRTSRYSKVWTIDQEMNNILLILNPESLARGFTNQIYNINDIKDKYVSLKVPLYGTNFNPTKTLEFTKYHSLGKFKISDENRELIYTSLFNMVNKLDKYDIFDNLPEDIFTGACYKDVFHYDDFDDPDLWSRTSQMFVDVVQYHKDNRGGANKVPLRSKVKTNVQVEEGYCGPGVLYLALNKDLGNDCIKGLGEAKRIKKNTEKVKHFADGLNIPKNMTFDDLLKFTEVYNEYKVIVTKFNPCGNRLRIVYEAVGEKYNDKHIFIEHTGDHYSLINHPKGYLTSNGNNKFCYKCYYVYKKNEQHNCNADKCESCCAIFVDTLEQHRRNKCYSECNLCYKKFLYKDCPKFHLCKYDTCGKCKEKYLIQEQNKHVCGQKFCRICNTYYNCVSNPYTESHRCMFRRSNGKLKEYNRFYAFDFEACSKDGLQIVTYIVLSDIFDDFELRFESLEEFINYLKNERDSVYIAHNGSKYDFILLYKKICELCSSSVVVPTDSVFEGNAIITFKFMTNVFIDSCRHIRRSLRESADAFDIGLQKSYFPYRFYTYENREYIGVLPSKEYFEDSDADNDFIEWYNDKINTEYNIKEEMIKYCAIDVQVLKRVLYEYAKTGKKHTGLNPLCYSTIGQYAYKVYLRNYVPEDKIPYLESSEEDFVKNALKGGRTENFVTYKENCNARYYDINSLYPTVMTQDYMPGCVVKFVRQKITNVVEFLNNLEANDQCAIVKYRCLSPDLHIPLLGLNHNNKFIFPTGHHDSYETCAAIRKAVSLGYKILILEYIVFKREYTLFKDYINTFYKIKEECDNGLHNAGTREFMKLMMNNLWGKLAQNKKPIDHKFVDTKAWNELIDKYNTDPNLDININYEFNDFIAVSCTKKECYKKKRNFAIACFVTSHARLRLYSCLEKCGTNIMYCDTDSVIVNDLVLDTSTELGALKDELKGRTIKSFVSPCPKVYGLLLSDNTYKYAIKGFSKNCVGFSTMHDLVKSELFGNSSSVSVTQKLFIRKNMEIIVDNEHVKKLSCIVSKRVLQDDYTTKPIKL